MMTKINQTIRIAFEQQRRRKNITMQALCHKVGTSHGTYCAIINGKRKRIRDEFYLGFCRELDLDPNTLKPLETISDYKEPIVKQIIIPTQDTWVPLDKVEALKAKINKLEEENIRLKIFAGQAVADGYKQEVN